jgi:hypothetical protein
MRTAGILALIAGAGAGVAACGGESWECQLVAGSDPDFSQMLGCRADFDELSSQPLSAAIPGATSVKTVFDRTDAMLYFQNSERFQIHWEFASAHLSGNGRPIVPQLGQFNTTEYYSPDRRFLLGAVTYYADPDAWVYEIAPYDTADADMIATAYRAIAKNAYIGDDLKFHPTSEAIELVAAQLPEDVQQITTEELFEGITYQPLNLGTSMGRLVFVTHTPEPVLVNYRDIAVLDGIPNDLSVVQGIITGTFQTPLSHLTVLSQNRGTPNMGLRDGYNDPTLRALEGKWIELVVEPFTWRVREVTQAEADAWWEEHRPEPVIIPPMDLSTTDLRDDEDLINDTLPLAEALRAIIPAYGGKASHFGGLVKAGPDVPHPDGFAVPLYYYDQFMTQNGFYTYAQTMMEDPQFRGDPAIRDQRLNEFRDMIKAAPIDPAFLALVRAKLDADFPNTRMRFRSSTNSEDLFGFTGAGLYDSNTYDPADPQKPLEFAIGKTWASIWTFRAFEEREYRSIPHLGVGMAMLVHPGFPAEEANGVALTANIFDTSGLEPGFFINVQIGENSVVQPPPGITVDSFIYYFTQPGQPIVYLSHSNLIDAGTTVISRTQAYALGKGLDAIHRYFAPAYAPQPGETGFYAMDIEFKFDSESGADPQLVIKQCRPHPGWGLSQ